MKTDNREKIIALAEFLGWQRGPSGITGEARWLPSNSKGLCYFPAVKAYLEELKEELNDIDFG